MDSNAVSAPWTDKALWLAVFSILVPFIARYFGVSLDAGQLATVAAITATYITAHKWKSGAVLLEETRQRTQAAPDDK